MKNSKLDKIQSKAVKIALKKFTQTDRILIQMATGTGKTNTAIKISQDFFKKFPSSRVLWLTGQNELQEQTAVRFIELGIEDVGLFGGKFKNTEEQVIVASVATISRDNHLKIFDPNAFDLVIVDECHHAPASSWEKAITYFKSKRLGITATAYRPDGLRLFKPEKGNEDLFGEVVFEYSFTQAQKDKVIAKDETHCILTNSVLEGLKTKDGDYSASALDRLWTSTERNNIIVDSYKTIALPAIKKLKLKPKAVCYCINVAHAKRMSELFKKNGIKSDFLSGDQYHQKPETRLEVMEKFRTTNDIEIVCAVNILSEGVDIPDINVVLMARPTRSNIIYQQQVGRAVRILLNKKKFILLDFVDNTRKEYQGYTMGNMVNKGTIHGTIHTRYIKEKDDIKFNERITDIMEGVRNFENKVIKSIVDIDKKDILFLEQNGKFPESIYE